MARTDNLNNFLTDVASAIKEKKGTDSNIVASNFDNEISNLPSGNLDEYLKTTISGTSTSYFGRDMLIKCPPVDTSKVTNANYMFSDCSGLVEAPLLDTSKVTTASRMFYNCVALTKTYPFDFSSLQDGGYMFYGCKWIKYLPVSNNLQNLTTSTRMFYLCSSILGDIVLDLPNLVNASYMFSGCSKITSLTLDLPNCEKMDYIAEGCKALITIDFTNVTKVNALNSAFNGCSNLETVSRMDVGNCTVFTSIFRNTPKVANLGGFKDLGKAYLTTQSANYSPYTFELFYCSALTYESAMNVINDLYDLASAGIQPQRFILPPHMRDILTEEEIAIVTNKGWNLSYS